MIDGLAISLNQVSKCYRLYERPQDRLKDSLLGRFGRKFGRDFWALNHISFTVKKGESFGIIGQNGSGKSTLLQIIAGIMQPSEGFLETEGRISALLELGSGFNPEFTGRENVFLNGAILGLKRADMEAKFDEIAAFAQIGKFIDQPVKSYSSGMFVRLAFSVAVCVDPDILLIDEALSVGDSLFQRRSYRRMEEMREAGTTIVLVTHDINAVMNFCNRAVLLDNGKVLKIGETKPVVNKYVHLVTTREKEYLEWLAEQSASSASGDDLKSPEIVSSPQENVTQEFRFGTGEATILDCHLLDSHGRRTEYWQHGEAGTVVVQARFERAVKRPVFGITISTITGIQVFGTNSWYAERMPGPQQPGTVIKVEFSFSVRINPGTYIMNCGLAELLPDETVVPLDRRYDLFAFRVLGSLRKVGLVDLETTIEYTLFSATGEQTENA